MLALVVGDRAEVVDEVGAEVHVLRLLLNGQALLVEQPCVGDLALGARDVAETDE